MLGKIVKLARSYGSQWGRIQPLGTDRELFFNKGSLDEGADFDELREGQVVEFEEAPDRANGSRAIQVVPIALPALRNEPAIVHRADADAPSRSQPDSLGLVRRQASGRIGYDNGQDQVSR